MKLFICISILFFGSTGLFAQVNLAPNQKDFIGNEVHKLVNELRVSKGIEPLGLSRILKSAAEMQTTYMISNTTLSHFQNSSKLRTPDLRVKSIQGGDRYSITGENILFTKPQIGPTFDTLKMLKIATELFEIWKASPPHYANMIFPDYGNSGIYLDIHPKSRVIYATQVFGSKVIEIENQLNKAGFTLEKASSNCADKYKDFSNLVVTLGNRYTKEGQEVILSFPNKSLFNKLFVHPLDGIVLDVLERNQFSCSAPSRLDSSPIYDGVLLKPVYRDELLKNNRAESEYRVITPIGTLPAALEKKEVSFSVLLLVEGKMCEYFIPCPITSKTLELLPFKPVLFDPPKVLLLDSGIIASEVLDFNFKTNLVQPNSLPKLIKNNNEVHLIKIESYSSIEGDLNKNELLHQKRAEFILEFVKKYRSIESSKLDIEAKENWNLFDFQMAMQAREDLLLLSKDSIKQRIAFKMDPLPWGDLLFQQRRSRATLYYTGRLENLNENKQQAELTFRTGVILKNHQLVNKALFEMSKQDEIAIDLLFSPGFEEYFFNEKRVIANYSALLSEVYWNDLNFCCRLLFAWQKKIDQLDGRAKANLLHLYTLIARDLLEEWDVSAQNLSNVVHPDKLRPFITEIGNKSLIVNVYLSFLDYYNHTNNTSGINESFDRVSDYLKSKSKKMDEILDMSLFFNYWSMFAYSKDALLPRFKNNTINEDGLFLLLEIGVHYRKSIGEDIYFELHEKAKTINTERYCEWLNANFQLLRDVDVRKSFCANCN
ncbi:MAG: CAP domain-containing protein [Bacteroidetes bacterium]|nr:CAP domain-containing protein [Bacteroidota bacterium]